MLDAAPAAPEIPVVFAIATDPAATGIVSSLAHPGGNATGMSYLGPDLAGKRVELLREVLPGLPRLGIMANRLAPGPMLELQDVESAAIKIGIAATLFKIAALDDIDAVFTSFKDRCDALYVCSDPLVNAGRFRIVSQALAAHVPTVFGERDSVSAGGLSSYPAASYRLSKKRHGRESQTGAEIWRKRQKKPEGDTDSENCRSNLKHNHFCNLSKIVGSAIPNIDLARAMAAMCEAVHTRPLEQAKVTRPGWRGASVPRPYSV